MFSMWGKRFRIGLTTIEEGQRYVTALHCYFDKVASQKGCSTKNQNVHDLLQDNFGQLTEDDVKLTGEVRCHANEYAMITMQK